MELFITIVLAIIAVQIIWYVGWWLISLIFWGTLWVIVTLLGWTKYTD